MANPQAENGHTDIANEIMDALCKIRISGEARQVLDFIIRKTYGWHKKEDDISLSQFVEGTGLNKTRVCHSIAKLITMNLIAKKGNVANNGNGWCSTYCFNKDYSLWRPLPKKAKVIAKKSKRSLPIIGHTKENYTKETTKEKELVLPSWIDAVTWNAFEEMRKKIKKPLTDHARNLIFEKLKTFKEKGHDPKTVLNNSIEGSWQGVFEPKSGGDGSVRQQKSFAQIESERQKRIKDGSVRILRDAIERRDGGDGNARSNYPEEVGSREGSQPVHSTLDEVSDVETDET